MPKEKKPVTIYVTDSDGTHESTTFVGDESVDELRERLQSPLRRLTSFLGATRRADPAAEQRRREEEALQASPAPRPKWSDTLKAIIKLRGGRYLDPSEPNHMIGPEAILYILRAMASPDPVNRNALRGVHTAITGKLERHMHFVSLIIDARLRLDEGAHRDEVASRFIAFAHTCDSAFSDLNAKFVLEVIETLSVPDLNVNRRLFEAAGKLARSAAAFDLHPSDPLDSCAGRFKSSHKGYLTLFKTSEK